MEEQSTWPPAVAEYIQSWILEQRSPAFLLIDGDGRVVGSGGSLPRYGAEQAETGTAAELFCCLEGMLPLDGERCVLSRVETAAGVFADIHLFRTPDGDCALLLDATEDVAERTRIEQALRQTEERLRHAEKMEALGRLAGGVAHDFNNLLTVILGYSSQMATDPMSPDELKAAAQEVKQAAERAAVMTSHLLSFSRRQVRRVEVLDLNAVISGVERMVRRLIGEDIRLETKLDPTLGCVEADRGQIEQILVNLAANARDAMPKGGSLTIRTGSVDIDADHALSRLRHGRYVSLSVTDTGCGMDAETMSRVFEPFFTRRTSGQGTGLGLSIVYGIVSQSGGEVDLSSEVGRGTCVNVLLPAVAKTLPVARSAQEGAFARGTETILVVEDEDGVRKLIRHVLLRLGYTVLEASAPAMALALCEGHHGPIDLLLTDFLLPEMDGSELAARMRTALPSLRILYVSGYAKESFARRGADLAGSTFLSKPFTPALLAEKVREALSSASAMPASTSG